MNCWLTCRYTAPVTRSPLPLGISGPLGTGLSAGAARSIGAATANTPTAHHNQATTPMTFAVEGLDAVVDGRGCTPATIETTGPLSLTATRRPAILVTLGDTAPSFEPTPPILHAQLRAGAVGTRRDLADAILRRTTSVTLAGLRGVTVTGLTRNTATIARRTTAKLLAQRRRLTMFVSTRYAFAVDGCAMPIAFTVCRRGAVLVRPHDTLTVFGFAEAFDFTDLG